MHAHVKCMHMHMHMHCHAHAHAHVHVHVHAYVVHAHACCCCACHVHVHVHVHVCVCVWIYAHTCTYMTSTRAALASTRVILASWCGESASLQIVTDFTHVERPSFCCELWVRSCLTLDAVMCVEERRGLSRRLGGRRLRLSDIYFIHIYI